MEFLLIGFIAVLVLVALLAARLTERYAPYPYKKRDESLFSATEEQFLTLLERGLGQQYRILTKVRLGDVVSVRNKGMSRAAVREAQGKVANRMLDYVLCDRTQGMRVVAVIELEANEPNQHQVKRNWFLKNSLTAAGIPFLRFKAKSGYRADELARFIESKLHQSDYVRAARPKLRGADGQSAPMAA
ncbi:DUF2726 domain-containing protein [Aliidiomarina maris]|uniref:Uncharacterized protein DUF2726 n=1 Tax=Aliidiomarina maris TaxID=531312 RepID=A0A327X4J9_9GAMM|nr:DUF2726 domain-containing protein [Aliidiomarina maris]MCL5049372.1 DUF2726 domain-containing protein [Bacillota bacterium]RAK00629.1 uncharacterized protein DUF2726 [Aliidiomarina maris]RUO27360.1 hypothetical protein CWE07_05305 [Aliidiomarina maris]